MPDHHLRPVHAGSFTSENVNHMNMESHVLLAACDQHQFMYKDTTDDGDLCGFFTNNLVQCLWHVKPAHTTYEYLTSMLPEWIDQKPQCVGKNKKRLLFNGMAVW